MQGLNENKPVEPTDEMPNFAPPRQPSEMVPELPYAVDNNGQPKKFTVLPRDQIYSIFKSAHPMGPMVSQWATQAHFEQRKYAARQRAAQAQASATPSTAEDPEFHQVGSIAQRTAQYLKAKGERMIHGQIDDEDAALRLSLCRHGGVRCAECGAPAGFDRDTLTWFCDPKTYETAQGCDWTMSHNEAVEAKAPPCQAFVHNDKGEFCTKCGCKQRADAELKTKTTFRLAPCPRTPAIWPDIKEDES